jgi:glycosyl transferase family 25
VRLTVFRKFRRHQQMKWVSDVDLFLYINLKDRKDRDREIQEVLGQQLKIPKNKIQRIEAIRQNPGFTGCTRSHLSALNYAIEAKANYICIFEDDFMLTVSPETFHHKVSQAWVFLKKFHILFLTMTPILLETTELKHFFRVRQALAMPAMIVHKSYFLLLKSIYETALKEKIPHDLVTQRYQKNDLWYGFYPALARQRPGFSDIEGRNVDYKFLDVDGQMLKIEDKSLHKKDEIIPSRGEPPERHEIKTMYGSLILMH